MAISIIQSMLYIKDAFANHVLVGPFEIYEILMRHNREETNPRANLRIGPTGNACVAAISVMVETIGGIVGCLEMVEATAALSAKGMMTEIPSPDYGYVRSSVILRERIGQSLYNDWVDGNLDGLTHVARQGGEPRRRVIHMPTAMVLVSIPHEVCARSRGEMRYAG